MNMLKCICYYVCMYSSYYYEHMYYNIFSLLCIHAYCTYVYSPGDTSTIGLYKFKAATITVAMALGLLLAAITPCSEHSDNRKIKEKTKL